MEMLIFSFIPIIIMMVLPIIQAVWIAMDARKRNDEYWWLWTIASLVTFPVLLIVYMLVTRTNRNSCSNCGKDRNKDLSICPYCGEQCGSNCPTCGEKLECGWNYCPKCTNKIPEENIVKNKNDSKATKKIIVTIIAVVVSIFLMFLIFSAVMVAFSNKIYGSNKVEITSSASWVERNTDSATWVEENIDSDSTLIFNTYQSENSSSESIEFPKEVGKLMNLSYSSEIACGSIKVKIVDNKGKVIFESDRKKETGGLIQPINIASEVEGPLKATVKMKKYIGAYSITE